MIEVSHLTRVFRTYKKQPGFWGGVRVARTPSQVAELVDDALR